MHGFEPPTALVEILAHMRRIGEFACQFVGPLVIGTDQLGDDGGACVENARSAVATDIADHPDLVVVIAQDDDADPADIQHDGVARFRHLAFQACIDPVAGEEHLEIRLEHIVSDVEPGRKGMTFRPHVEQGGDGGGEPVKHDAPLSDHAP